jgi:hypothetical protein
MTSTGQAKEGIPGRSGRLCRVTKDGLVARVRVDMVRWLSRMMRQGWMVLVAGASRDVGKRLLSGTGGWEMVRW